MIDRGNLLFTLKRGAVHSQEIETRSFREEAVRHCRTGKPVVCRDENYERPTVVCSLQACHPRFSREDQNPILEDKINHDRTEKLVVCRDKNHVRHQSRGVINVLDNVDLVPSNVRFSHQEALLYVFEDNEAVIKMVMKGRCPTMRHVSRTHRVALDWLFDRINLDPKIQIKKIDTKNQLADMLTDGNFKRDEWNQLLCLFNISHFSSAECSEVMSKRT